MLSIRSIAVRPASHTDRARSRPHERTRLLNRRSLTIVRCALVWPLSRSATRPRSKTATECPPRASRYADSQTRDACADDDDLDAKIAIESGETAWLRPSNQNGVVLTA